MKLCLTGRGRAPVHHHVVVGSVHRDRRERRASPVVTTPNAPPLKKKRPRTVFPAPPWSTSPYRGCSAEIAPGRTPERLIADLIPIQLEEYSKTHSAKTSEYHWRGFPMPTSRICGADQPSFHALRRPGGRLRAFEEGHVFGEEALLNQVLDGRGRFPAVEADALDAVVGGQLLDDRLDVRQVDRCLRGRVPVENEVHDHAPELLLVAAAIDDVLHLGQRVAAADGEGVAGQPWVTMHRVGAPRDARRNLLDDASDVLELHVAYHPRDLLLRRDHVRQLVVDALVELVRDFEEAADLGRRKAAALSITGSGSERPAAGISTLKLRS